MIQFEWSCPGSGESMILSFFSFCFVSMIRFVMSSLSLICL